MATQNCVRSPMIEAGYIYDSQQCTIAVNSINASARTANITVTPRMGVKKTPTTLSVREDECFIFLTAGGNFRVTVWAIFISTTKGLVFDVCNEV